MGKVLVTGGSGRFAKYMVQALRDKYEVTLFSRSQPPEDRADLPWIDGDLNNYDDCVKAVQGVEDLVCGPAILIAHCVFSDGAR